MPAAPCDDDHNPAVGATFRAKRLSRWSRDATLMTRTTFYVRTRMLMTQETGVGWSTCGEVGCIGIRLDASWTCLAHATEEERAAALKLVGETGAIDARGVPVTATLLEQVLTVVPRGASGQPHIKNCWFDRATFTGNASFDRATFTGKSSFDRATFAGNASFEETTFTGDARFDGASFTGLVHFVETTFTGDARFDWATFASAAFFVQSAFSGDASFEGATFTGGAGFDETTFSGIAVFGGATFSNMVRFGRATFSDVAVFGGATFTGNADFGRATFSDFAGFGRATFTGNANFGQTTFTRDAIFMGATFTGDARFAGATFIGDANFSRATFGGEAAFAVVTFKRLAAFYSVAFEQTRLFGPLLAYRGLILDDSQFAQSVRIEVSTAGLCCRRARFPAGVQFRLRWARVVLDDADFPAPSTIAGIPPMVDVPEWRAAERRIARAWRRLLAGEISERPQLLSLRRANVAGLGLSNVSVADCRFAGAHNLDKLRLESDVSFAGCRLPLGRLRRAEVGRVGSDCRRARLACGPCRTAAASSSDADAAPPLEGPRVARLARRPAAGRPGPGADRRTVPGAAQGPRGR